MPELVIAPSARADLRAQWDYYADEVGRPDLADRFTAQAEPHAKSWRARPASAAPAPSAIPNCKIFTPGK